jgi:uncharacterized protein YjbI with pentapeptide repeats/predicted ATP-binding protein involved in virulence
MANEFRMIGKLCNISDPNPANEKPLGQALPGQLVEILPRPADWSEEDSRTWYFARVYADDGIRFTEGLVAQEHTRLSTAVGSTWPYQPASETDQILEALAVAEITRLKQGVAKWNEWREQFPEAEMDLRRAKLSGANLSGANLSGANLTGADLSGADLSGADLSDADLSRANLSRANLSRADLNGANLNDANLRGADLTGADLSDSKLSDAKLSDALLSYAKLGGANLRRADLSYAQLSRADLSDANLRRAELGGADLRDASLSETIFADVNLSEAIGLEACVHRTVSIIDFRTLKKSKSIPLTFLRGVGLPDNLIDYLPSLLGQAIQYYSCFISYSQKDEDFAKRLHADLQNSGVRCWFAPHDMRIGEKIADTIDAVIRLRDKILLILSENSIASDWLEHEVKKAYEEERTRGQSVLFPIRLDDAVQTTKEAWAAKLRQDRHIGDFTSWKDHDAYRWSFERILRDLKFTNPGERYRELSRGLRIRKADEDALSQINLSGSFTLQAFEWSDVSFFSDGGYRFSPRVNVLLGRNGYGKTLLFRSLVAVLQRDEKYSGLLFAGAPLPTTKETWSPRLTARVTRNFDKLEEIVRDTTYFLDLVGKIPLLAIPDSRFLNRDQTAINLAVARPEPLSQSGGMQFLTQEPYDKTIQELLTTLFLDHQSAGEFGSSRSRGFDAPIFRLIERVVRELTEDDAFAFEAINRLETGFEILVRTFGGDRPIPIQRASQGTLSVVVVFGLIYRFLQSLGSRQSSQTITDNVGAGIVLIDEIDAHLHPIWQQKILAILTREFPNVQFIVSAHNPLIVAGCDRGEVSVLRRAGDTNRFYVETLQEDFLGATAEDLYRRLFDIENPDRLYLEYSTKGIIDDHRAERESQIEELASKPSLSKEEQDHLNFLERENRLMDKALLVRDQRLKSERQNEDFTLLEAEIDRLKYQLRMKDKEITEIRQVVAGHEGETQNGAIPG